jgi:uncharacterized protein (DUF2141 family)
MMFTPFFLTLSFFFLENSLTVTIDNCKSSKGKIYIALYDNEKAFMQEPQAVSKKIVPIENGKAKVTFSSLATKDYAFVFFHDENGNGKLDTNLFGIPTEGYGFSNNAKGTFGPPSYSKSKLAVQAGSNRTTVRLNY